MTLREARAVVSTSALVLAVLGLAAASACRRAQPLCEFCRMPIPEATVATVVIDGREQRVCDPRCAVTHQQQTGDATTIGSVTDFASGGPLDPARAFYLTGSDTAPDVGQARMGRPMEPVYREWHRCLPSVLAFGSREAAARYAARHGGTVQTLGQLGLAARTAGGARAVRVSPGS